MEKMILINGNMLVEEIQQEHPIFKIVTTQRGQNYRVVAKDKSIKEYEVGDTVICTQYAGVWREGKLIIHISDCHGRIRNGITSGVFNHVIIKLDRLGNEYITKDGTKFTIPTKWAVHDTAPIHGTVAGVPEMLHYGKGRNEMSWDCDMQLKVGDKVWFEHSQAIDALGIKHDENTKLNDPKFFVDNGAVYIFVQYEYIIVSKRGEEVIPLNGICLINPDEIKFESESIISTVKKTYSKRKGTVRHIGKPNREYKHPESVDPDRFPKAPTHLTNHIEFDDLKIGDKVEIKGDWNIQLESGFQNTFSQEILYCVQFRGIELIY